MRHFFHVIACALVGLGLSAHQSNAQTLAEDGLAKTIERLEADPNSNPFELGMLQTLRSLEQSLQTRYEFGLGQRIPLLPVLRIQGALVPNPRPKQADAGTISDIMRQFVKDMETARATLLQVGEDADPFELTIQDIWLDVDGNGQRDESEGAVELLGDFVFGARSFASSEQAATPITVRFDASDHAWLVAYTHMLSGFGHLFLAFDPEPVFQNLQDEKAALANAPEIPNVFDPEELTRAILELEAESDALLAQMDALNIQIDDLRDAYSALWDEHQKLEEGDEKDAVLTKMEDNEKATNELLTERGVLRRSERFIRAEIRANQSKQPDAIGDVQLLAAQQAETFDFVYVLIRSLDQQPDRDHIRAVRDNWISMIDQNRVFWARIAAETDNDREWIPNASQDSVLPFDIPDGTPEAWQAILADVESVLNGKLLITHPLLPPGYGISIPAYVEDPSPLSLLEWVHGIGAYRYAAKGPRLTPQSWAAFQRLTDGNGGGFAIFYN